VVVDVRDARVLRIHPSDPDRSKDMKAYEEKIRHIATFLQGEDGAVTVDWVVLAAAVVLLSVPMMVVMKDSTETAATGVAADIVANVEQSVQD
jgi:hypothetical protein